MSDSKRGTSCPFSYRFGPEDNHQNRHNDNPNKLRRSVVVRRYRLLPFLVCTDRNAARLHVSLFALSCGVTGSHTPGDVALAPLSRDFPIKQPAKDRHPAGYTERAICLASMRRATD
jgi:hypothetical protein